MRRKQAEVLLRRLLFLPVWALISLVLLAGGLLFYTFLTERQEDAVAYLAYVLSAYALTAVTVRIPGLVRRGRAIANRHPFTAHYLRDRAFRARLSLYTGLGVNLIYVVFRLGAGILYRSGWFLAVGTYYLVLSLSRFSLLRQVRTAPRLECAADRRVQGLKSYRRCGALMFVLAGAMSGMVVQMVWKNEGYRYPGVTIYASAAFAFYLFVIAIVNLVRFRGMKEPVLSAAKMLSFAGAMMSILTLQTAMLQEFGGSAQFRQQMNGLTGSCVCLGTLTMAVMMIAGANRRLKRPNNQEGKGSFCCEGK